MRDDSDEPIPGLLVEIDLGNCAQACLDPAGAGLTGVTDDQGTVVLDPRGGGCDAFEIRVQASGVTVGVYPRVRSADWSGSWADGAVAPEDLARFAAAFNSGQGGCHDDDGDGVAGATDLARFAAAFLSGDENGGGCAP